MPESAEIERKFETDPDFSLPDLTGLPGVAQVSAPQVMDLEATYVDTPDLRLAAHRYALRRRTGGHDAGWHLKRPRADGFRDEIQEPLGDPEQVPAALRRLIEVYVRGEPLAPVVRIDTRRTATTLRDADGTVLLELAADDVTASVIGADGAGGEVKAWHELEAELVHGDLDLLDAVTERLETAGARRSSSPSKLARALGDRVRRPDPAQLPLGSAVAALDAYLRQQVEDLRAQDPLVRHDAPDAVHQMRVGCRRLRAVLAAYRPVLDSGPVEPVREELRWLGEVLGAARDSEVVRDRLRGEVAAQPPELVLGPVEQRIVETFGTRYRQAHDRALEEMNGQRYFALLDALDRLVADPPPGPEASLPAGEVIRARLRKTYARTALLVDDALAQQDRAQRELRLHEVRKSAKRARYAAEAAGAVLGAPARGYGKAMKAVQEVLGEHQDSVVAREELRALAVAAYGDGENAFTYGRLHGLEECRAAEALTRFDAAWRTVRKSRLR
ncbi:MAG: CYTH and CHAD domain-containing protein [Kineosporiaceae bacterium]